MSSCSRMLGLFRVPQVRQRLATSGTRQLRMAPAGDFTRPQHQQSVRAQQSGQAVEQLAAAFAGEVDQYVLAVDQVEPAQRRARRVQQVDAGETDTLAQAFADAELVAARDRLDRILAIGLR